MDHRARRRRSARGGSSGAGTRRRDTSGDGELPVDNDDVDANPEQRGRAIVLRLLTGQPRTRAELERALRRRGIPDSVVTDILGRFTEVGLIDDAAFARAWVESRHAGRGLARRALAYELRRRGVDEEHIGAAVEQLSPETELSTARSLVVRRLRAVSHLDGRTRIRRLTAMLVRKGYSPTMALRAVRDVLDERADSLTDDDERRAVEELAGAIDTLEEPPDGSIGG